MDNIALEENVESLKEALEESNAKTAELKLVNTAVEAKIQIFMKKHIEIEGKKKLVREYQWKMCNFESGYKGEVINHMSINHDEVDK